MNNILRGILVSCAGTGLIIAICMIAPALLLWGVNTVSEQGNLGFYIPHNFWTYLAGYAVMIPLRGGCPNNE